MIQGEAKLNVCGTVRENSTTEHARTEEAAVSPDVMSPLSVCGDEESWGQSF